MKSVKKDRKFMEEFHSVMSEMYSQEVNLAYCEHSKSNSGSTIAFKRVFPNSRMVSVSVSYCAPEDKYDREIGAVCVLNKFFDGECIQMPLGMFSEKEIASMLSQRFN